jgi:hypothetical protein
MAGIDSNVAFYRKAERLISAKKSNAARSPRAVTQSNGRYGRLFQTKGNPHSIRYLHPRHHVVVFRQSWSISASDPAPISAGEMKFLSSHTTQSR